MLLSILIPTYNYDCSGLVTELARQLSQNMEIIVGDDGSTDKACQERLSRINGIAHCKLWKAPQNMGRSAIRNTLARMAQGEWLIFMDSDAELEDKDYVKKYLQNTDVDVVVGGTRAPSKCPSPEVSLRYKYERNYWQKASLEWRRQRGFDGFTAFNFMIRREVMLRTPFDETCSTYGHEDTLLGKALEDNGASLRHIDNPLIHAGLDTNADFLTKTETALRALKEQDGTLGESSALVKAHRRMKALHLIPLLKAWHYLAGRCERANLCSRTPMIALFNIYKLGYYATLK